jgi:DNA-directed RNA polymerase specialized sigma24 family protein
VSRNSDFAANSPRTATDGGARADPEREIADLLARMRDGDREAAATFITRYGSRIRRRVRGKLSRATRAVFDSQDILSTVGRRLDQYVHTRRLEAQSVAQLWSLVATIAQRVAINKAVATRRQAILQHELAPRTAPGRRGGHDADWRNDVPEVEIVLGALPDDVNRRILALWLDGASHADIASSVGLSAAAVRQRWLKIRALLRQRFAPRAEGGS